MNPPQAVCNYALLRFLPYPETGEFVNVGVLVTCQQPCLLHFTAETGMTERVKALFPRQNDDTFAAALEALRKDMERVQAGAHDPKSCQRAFNEVVRPRESVFRFGEVRTLLTGDPGRLADELFGRYVKMEAKAANNPALVTA